ncbi:MAG: hypothetical protein RLZ83_927, partial [Pseudomonadota bacterium]
MSFFGEKAFKRAGGLARAGQAVAPSGGAMFGSGADKAERGEDWSLDADWARLEQEPLRARWLVRLAVLFVALLVLWASQA